MSGITTRDLTYAALFTALIAAGAWIAIPLGSVPFTLQVTFVLLAGMVLGPRLGALSVAAYLCLGLVAPVYAGGASGLGVLIGPTGGYLWGFIPAVIVTGWLAGRQRASLVRLVLSGIAGLVPIYVLGASWLAVQLHLSPAVVITVGVLPFLSLDVLKAIVAGLAARSLVSLPLGLPAARETADVGERLAAQPQIDAPALVLAHEVGRAAVAIGEVLVAQHLREDLDVVASPACAPAIVRSSLSASNELRAPRYGRSDVMAW